jgi:hypothetical protein
MTLQFERKYSTQGSEAPCRVSFGFFSGFFGIFLAKLQMDPQPESTTQPKARGLSYGPPWAYYLSGYQDRLLSGPLGLPYLCCTAPDGVKHKDYGGEVLD